MNSTLKIAIPLGLLIAVVFAVTFFSQYTPNEDPAGPGNLKVSSGQRPLVFFSNRREWWPLPTARDGLSATPLADQIFPGFYEVGETQHDAAFWFENRNAAPVTLQLEGVSCSACSGGRLAAIPPDSMRQLLQMNAVSLLPTGPIAGCPTGMAGAAAGLFGALQWQSHMFNQDPTQVVYNVPPAANADGWSPQWGILDLNFKVRPNPSVPLQAAFVGQVPGTEQRENYRFEIFFQAAPAFDVNRTQIDVGSLTETSSEQTHDVIVYSSTRTPEELRSLNVAAHVRMPGGEPGPFVTVGEPVLLSEQERKEFADNLAARIKQPVKILSALRIPIKVRPKVGDERVDIGRLEREIWISSTLSGNDPKRVVLSGTVTGPVMLADSAEINLGSFPFRRGYNSQFDVITERASMDLKVVPEECSPKFLKVSLEKQPDRNGRGHYKLAVQVPPGEQQGEINGGVVVLQIQGKNPQKVRFPVKGRGTIR
jgi:hypothetical protein